jgi:transposase-like protein
VKKKPDNKVTLLTRSSAAEYLTFITAKGEGGVEAIYADEDVWLSQKMMAALYDVDVRTINYHLQKVFKDSELAEEAVIRKFRITATDGKNYDTGHYNLSAIIAVGYKVNSERAVQFRKWATIVVKEYTVKGFAMDDERLKAGGTVLTKQYFEEQLQRVREIRLSERKFYQKITDIYATAIDYDLSATATQRFFATVQNKLHWAIHGHTAAEVIVDRADAGKQHMGLTTWKDLISNDRQLGASGEPGWAYPELCHHREVRAMAMNRIQFQPGLSMPEFAKRFGTESQCAAALEAARWPNGFSCPRCGGAGHCVLRGGSCKVFQCNACRHQTSLSTGTVFQGTKLPLTVWFLAIYLISQAKTGLSALALKRHLGVSYPTAWLIHHKLMRAMEQREERYVLEGQVQVDDAYLGGERTGGKVGRGSENKVPFVAAVSFSEEGHPLRAKLTLVPGFTLTAIAQWAKSNLAPGSTVLSDGLACFNAVIDAGCVHQPTVVAGRKPKDLPEFKWVNTVLGNLKTSLSGCYHALAFRKYGAQYLAAFAYRFNRRFDLRTLNARLLLAAVACSPLPQRSIRAADVHC